MSNDCGASEQKKCHSWLDAARGRTAGLTLLEAIQLA